MLMSFFFPLFFGIGGMAGVGNGILKGVRGMMRWRMRGRCMMVCEGDGTRTSTFILERSRDRELEHAHCARPHREREREMV